MVKHNNVVPNAHFHKDWQSHVRTHFDQPAKRAARAAARVAKAKRVYPRPVNALRPVVRGQTVKYNTKIRVGRGFTLEEHRAAKISPVEALSLGIAVDHRRKNRSTESLQANVARLRAYADRLIVFPRSHRARKEFKKTATPTFTQVRSKNVLPVAKPEEEVEFQAITEQDRKRKSQYATLRRAHVTAKLWGYKEKMHKEKLAKMAAAEKKAAKSDA